MRIRKPFARSEFIRFIIQLQRKRLLATICLFQFAGVEKRGELGRLGSILVFRLRLKAENKYLLLQRIDQKLVNPHNK